MVAEALGEAETAGWIGLAPLTLYVQTDKILISMFLWVSYFWFARHGRALTGESPEHA